MILGLDISTKMGTCFTDGESFQTSQVSFPSLSGMERVMAFADWMDSFIKTHPVELVVIEGYGFANANTLATLVEVGTAIRMMLYVHGIKYVEVAPNSLKKYALGTGAGKKEQMIVGVFKRWGFEAKTNDEVDAYVLARIGLHIIGHNKAEIVAQQEVVDVVTGEKKKPVKRKKPSSAS